MSLDRGSAQSCSFDFLPQINHRQGVITAPVVACDDLKVIGPGDKDGRIGAVEQLDQGHWSLVLQGCAFKHRALGGEAGHAEGRQNVRGSRLSMSV